MEEKTEVNKILIGFIAGVAFSFFWALSMIGWIEIDHLQGTPSWTVTACIIGGVATWFITTSVLGMVKRNH